MRDLRQHRLIPLIGLLAVLTLLFAACAAPAAAPSTGAEPAATAAEGAAAAPAASSDLPAEAGRGTDGPLTIIYWQEVSIMNPYLASGTKDYHAASLVLDALLEVTPDGTIIPALAQEVPTLENGGISEDLTTITYQLKPDLIWADGTPVTADDVVFSWQFCTTPEAGCTSGQAFAGVTSVEALDPLTVKITFDGPTPYPYAPFGGNLAPVLQKAQFADCLGAAAQSCSEANTNPIGTGPYKVKEFRANDTVVFEINENYRDAGKPHFSEVTIRGSEDASASARAVLETGEADYGWNLQVEPAVLADMEAKGNGKVVSAFAGLVERILINFTNPDPNLGDKRSEWTAEDPNPHPFLSDLAVRQALSMAIDRNVIAEQLYGAGGKPTCNILSGPPNVASPNNDACLTQDIEGANKLLDDAGYLDSNGDGIRETPDGTPLKILYQTSTNSVRQKTQALVQQWWKQIGIDTELKNVEAAVFFGGDPASPDTLNKFFTDVQMYANNPESLDPQGYLAIWLCEIGGKSNIAASENDWNAPNVERWCNPDYDAKFAELQATTDPAERARLSIELNDMLAQDVVNIPLIFRGDVSAHANSLLGVELNGWDSQLWNIEDWTRAR